MRIFDDDILASTLLLVSSTTSDLWAAVHLFVCEYVVNREIYKDHKNRVQAFHRIYQRRSVFNFGSDGDGFISRASDRHCWQINWQIFSRVNTADINWVKLATAVTNRYLHIFNSIRGDLLCFYIGSEESFVKLVDLIVLNPLWRKIYCLTNE